MMQALIWLVLSRLIGIWGGAVVHCFQRAGNHMSNVNNVCTRLLPIKASLFIIMYTSWSTTCRAHYIVLVDNAWGYFRYDICQCWWDFVIYPLFFACVQIITESTHQGSCGGPYTTIHWYLCSIFIGWFCQQEAPLAPFQVCIALTDFEGQQAGVCVIKKYVGFVVVVVTYTYMYMCIYGWASRCPAFMYVCVGLFIWFTGLHEQAL